MTNNNINKTTYSRGRGAYGGSYGHRNQNNGKNRYGHQFVFVDLLEALEKKNSADGCHGILKESLGKVSLDSERAEEILQTIKAIDDLSVPIFNQVIRRLCTQKKWDTLKTQGSQAAQDLLDRMKYDGLVPDVETYNTLLRSHCRNGVKTQAYLVFEDMLRRRVSPDITTYNTLVDGYCKEKDTNHAVQLLLRKDDGSGVITGKLFKDLEISPNVKTYNMVMKALCKKGEMTMVENMFRRACEGGIVPDMETYNILIKGYGKQGHIAAMEEILEGTGTVGAALSDAQCTPNAETRNTLIQAYCEADEIGKAMAEFEQMNYSEVATWSFVALARYYIKNGDYDAACEYIDRTGKGGVVDVPVCMVIIDDFVSNGRIEEAKRYMQKIRDQAESHTTKNNGDVVAFDCHDFSYGAATLVLDRCLGWKKPGQKSIQVITGQGWHSKHEMYNMKNRITEWVTTHPRWDRTYYVDPDKRNAGVIWISERQRGRYSMPLSSTSRNNS